MSEIVDADELLRRIRHARDWALSQEDEYDAKAEAKGATLEGTHNQLMRQTFNIVRVVLDEIVEPGKHSPE